MGSFHYIGLAALLGKGRAAVHDGTVDNAEDEFVGKVQDATPVDTGTLSESVHVASVERTATSVTVTVATGGEADEYAVYVHEGTSDTPAFKFMEQPLIANAEPLRESIARAARGQF